METEMLNAQENLGRVDTTVAGTVRIGAPDDLGFPFLAPRLGRLMGRYPDLKIQLGTVPCTLTLCPQREADIAITY